MNEEFKHFYEFGAFRLNAREKILYHGEIAVQLKPKAIETLIVLVENAGSVVSKTDLMSAVWQEVFVEENNLSVNIYELRKAFVRFGESNKFIETVSRRGFRFNAAVEKVTADKKSSVQEKSDERIAGEELKMRAAPQIERTLTNEAAANQIPAVSVRDKSSAQLPLRFQRRGFIAALSILCVVIGGGGWLYAWRGQAIRKINSDDSAQIRQPERGTNSIEAYQFYLRGRELWQTRENAKMAEGIEFFRRAIALDPNFAAPYTGIADSLSMMRNNTEDWRQAEEYADKAIRLAPDSADARATLGFIHAMNKWEWQTAENHFRRALELDPNSGKAHQWYATLLMIERRFDEAETHLKRAIEIEPLSPNFNGDLCELYVFAKRGDEAFAQCSRTNDINPDFQYVSVGEVLIQQKRYDEAARERLKADLRTGLSESEAKSSAWYKAYRKDGFRGWVQNDIGNYKNREDVLLGEYNLSIAYARLGDKEKTLELLEKCFAGRAFLLPFANARPDFDFVRGDERFQNLMRRVGLN